mgnify:CR=1 FL=1
MRSENPETPKAFSYALRLLNYRERSRREVREKLERKKFTAPVIGEVLDKLEDLGLIDDEKFARLWIRSRIRFKPRSSWLIGRELREKGIKEEMIGPILEEEYPAEEEREAVRSLAARRIRYYRRDNRETARRKLYAYLARRGFSGDMISKAVGEVLAAENDN